MIENRTRQYLSPILHTFPVIWKKEFEKADIICFAVMDALYYKAKKIEFKELLFVVFKNYQGLVNASRNIKGFYDEYPYDKEFYVCVFEIPKDFTNAYRKFLIGKYSQMYSRQQLRQLAIPEIHQGKINNTYLVLTKNHMAIDYYKKEVRRYFDSEATDNPDEYDIPPLIKQEVINFKGNIQLVKQLTPLINL